MRLFCIGGSLERDDKVDDETLRYDKDGNPTFEPYINKEADGSLELKNIETLSYPDIYELIQLNKYIHNCKRIDKFDDMLSEHKDKLEQVMNEFNKDSGRNFTFVAKKAGRDRKAQEWRW
jgi:hypothetical protein